MIEEKTRKIVIIAKSNSNFIEIEDILRDHLFDVKNIQNGEEAFDYLKENKDIDLVLMDILVDGIYGIELCKMIRKERPLMPIIFVTKIKDETELVLCLEAGADDAITIPYKESLLIARINAKLRSVNIYKQVEFSQKISVENIKNIDDFRKISFGKWTYMPKKCTVSSDEYGEEHLTDKENALIRLFLSDPQQVYSRDEISKYLNMYIKNSTKFDVNIHIHRLRNKLTQGNNIDSPIKAVRSKGYTIDSYLVYSYDNKKLKI